MIADLVLIRYFIFFFFIAQFRKWEFDTGCHIKRKLDVIYYGADIFIENVFNKVISKESSFFHWC